MACGTPVVGAAVGGISTTVVDGETGFLVPPRDPDALADRLAQLFRDPHLAHRLGQQAARRANALFTWERVAGEVARVYAEVIDGRTRRARQTPGAPCSPPASSESSPASWSPRRPIGDERRPAVFLDKDGTLIENVPYNVDPELVRLTPGADEGLRLLHEEGYRLIVVSNQPGVALGYFPESALAAVEARVRQILAAHGVPLAGFEFCPHHPEGRMTASRPALRLPQARAGDDREGRNGRTASTSVDRGSWETSSTTSRPVGGRAAGRSCWTSATRRNGYFRRTAGPITGPPTWPRPRGSSRPPIGARPCLAWRRAREWEPAANRETPGRGLVDRRARGLGGAATCSACGSTRWATC